MLKQAEYFRMVSIAESLVREGHLEQSVLNDHLRQHKEKSLTLVDAAEDLDRLVSPILERIANDNDQTPDQGDVAA